MIRLLLAQLNFCTFLFLPSLFLAVYSYAPSASCAYGHIFRLVAAAYFVRIRARSSTSRPVNERSYVSQASKLAWKDSTCTFSLSHSPALARQGGFLNHHIELVVGKVSFSNYNRLQRVLCQAISFALPRLSRSFIFDCRQSVTLSYIFSSVLPQMLKNPGSAGIATIVLFTKFMQHNMCASLE